MLSFLHIGGLFRPLRWRNDMQLAILFGISLTLSHLLFLSWFGGTLYLLDLSRSTPMVVSRMGLRVGEASLGTTQENVSGFSQLHIDNV